LIATFFTFAAFALETTRRTSEMSLRRVIFSLFPIEREMLVQKDGRMSISLSIGKREEMTRRKLISLVRRVVSSAKAAKVKKVAINFADFIFPHLDITKEELAN
jgi:hypothetical protein